MQEFIVNAFLWIINISAVIAFIAYLEWNSKDRCPKCKALVDLSKAKNRTLLKQYRRDTVVGYNTVWHYSGDRSRTTGQTDVPIRETLTMQEVMLDMECPSCKHNWSQKRTECIDS